MTQLIQCSSCSEKGPFKSLRYHPPYGTGFYLSGRSICQNEQHCDDCLSKTTDCCQSYQPLPSATPLDEVAYAVGLSLQQVTSYAWTELINMGLATPQTTKEEFQKLLGEGHVDKFTLTDYWIDSTPFVECPHEV